MSATEEAFELLLIEEADAWFEYLEATRGRPRPATRSSSPGRGLDSANGYARSALAAPVSVRLPPDRASK